MGITINYRGTVDDLDRIKELEDRVADLVFALGGQAMVGLLLDQRYEFRQIQLARGIRLRGGSSHSR